MLALPTMEAFSLLKYWRGGGGGSMLHSGGAPASSPAGGRDSSGTTSFVTADAVESDEDGPFFDLEFAVPDDEDEEDNASTCAENGEEGEESDEEAESDGGGTDEEGEFNFTLSSDSGDDPNLTLSPSDDLFFKGRLVTVEPTSLALDNGSEPNSSKPTQFPVSLLKSATKFRVMMLGFKKSKTEPNRHACPKQQKPEQAPAGERKEKKFLTVKFKVEEVRIMSLFTRDNSTARSSTAKQGSAAGSSEEISSIDEKRFSKDVMQKYLRKVKPLYVRVSRRYGEKLRFSGQLSLGSGPKPAHAPPEKAAPTTKPAASEKSAQPPTEATEGPAPGKAKTHKQGNITAGFRVVCKHLGKSRSASSAVAAAPPAPVPSKRRDDSLLQQQDWIQGAILHCKKSFNASRESDSSVLPRSVSDSATDKLDESVKSAEEDGVA